MIEDLIQTKINEKWDLFLPAHRAERTEWPFWEKERLASMYEHLFVEPELRRYVAGTMNRSDKVPFIIDIGAEEGDMSALFAKWGCRVGLVEPGPKVWPNIKAIWEGNHLPDPVFCLEGFIAAGSSETWFLHDGWPSSADGEVRGDHGFRQLKDYPQQMRVSIDDLVKVVGVPDAITMDVEGAEYEVIMGAQKTLEEHSPMLWISVHPEFMYEQFGKYSRDLFNYIECWGYKYELLAFDHEWHVRFYKP